jgi:lipopolysaccharide/colanic/teichoic acid biosynthesis glycosyltransferase
MRLARICDRERVDFKVVPSCFEALHSGLALETIGGIPVMGVSRLPLDRIVNRVVKRLFDIVGGVFGLILSVPIILVFGCLIYSKSPGPIFYRQRRFGRNGKPFNMVKLRVGRIDSDKAGNAERMVRNDPGGLDVDAFMRRWNIEKIPQFWNVLRGEMSLVGPRPERLELIKTYTDEIAHYSARYSTKPGITGWAQVCGIRGNTNMRERIRCELWYLENWGLLLDLQILFVTLIRQKNKG